MINAKPVDPIIKYYYFIIKQENTQNLVLHLLLKPSFVLQNHFLSLHMTNPSPPLLLILSLPPAHVPLVCARRNYVNGCCRCWCSDWLNFYAWWILIGRNWIVILIYIPILVYFIYARSLWYQLNYWIQSINHWSELIFFYLHFELWFYIYYYRKKIILET